MTCDWGTKGVLLQDETRFSLINTSLVSAVRSSGQTHGLMAEPFTDALMSPETAYPPSPLLSQPCAYTHELLLLERRLTDTPPIPTRT